jgi:UDP-N-acetylmuramate: L-alanyl-gamma-D-glutamyl-meso-diaminopimelate ligase
MHVHILGICGTFMAGIAAIARAAGHRVTGSDRGVYPPMSEQLAALGITITEGYEADQLNPAPDVVVVGNVMTRGVPVVEALLNSRIPYVSGPEWLAHNVLRQRQVVGVSGTHGKTTTTSLLAWILEHAGLSPGFLIGGVPGNFGESARLGQGAPFVIEADEYDTAFFDKRAKFLHYRPDVLIMNNLEFDHADIYPDLASIQRQFHQLVRGMPGRGRLIVKADDQNLAAVLAQGCWTPVETFASRPDIAADWAGIADGDRFVLYRAGAEVGRIRWGLMGNHNAENATAAVAAAAQFGVPPRASLDALGEFAGVKRRLELRGRFGEVELYDDFAHHPTAIARTIAGLRRSASGSGRVLAVLEPRSNTMRMGVHGAALGESLGGADRVWIYRPPGLDWDLDGSLREVRSLAVCDRVEDIVAGVVADARSGDRVLVMSNGGFQGIHALLEAALASRS